METIIDWALSLQYAHNRAELAKELLEMLIAEMPTFKSGIEAACANKDVDILKTVLHKLHGGCCYCGVPTLKQTVYDMETFVKREGSIPKHKAMQTLYKAIDAVVAAAPQFLTADSQT